MTERLKAWTRSKPLLTTALAGSLGALVATAQAHAGLHALPEGDAIHRVAPGDTMFSLARRHGMSVQTLAEINGIDDPDHIEIGRALRVTAPADGRVQLSEQAEGMVPGGAFSADDGDMAASPEMESSIVSRGARTGRSVSSASEAFGGQAQPAAQLNIPVVVERRQYAPVVAEITTQELVSISPRGLAQSLESVLNRDAYEAISALGAGLAAPSELEPFGVRVRLNPATLAIEAELDVSARSGADLSLGLEDRFGGPVIMPSRYAVGVTGVINARGPIDGDGATTGTTGLSGFANVGGIDGVNLDFGAIYDFSDVTLGDRLRRDRTLLFHDDRQRLLRYSAGDQAPLMPRLAGTFDTLGIGVERNYQTLQPRRNVRPAGRRSFVLDRPSVVEVYVNNALVSRFNAQPGPVNLDDIPLAALANEITIIVEDDLGRRELDSFSLAADITLLAPGLTEFSFNIGAVRDQEAFSQFDYTDDLAVGGTITRGLSEALTLGGHAIYSEALSTAGASAAFSVLNGVALAEAAASDSRDAGTGYAASLSYRGGPYFGVERGDILTVRLDYYSEDFTSFSDPLGIAAIEWDIGADYRLNITDRVAASFGGAYTTRYTFDEADRSLFAGVSRRFEQVNVSVTARYSQRPLVGEDVGVFISLTRPFGARTFGSVSYDSINETTRAEIRRARGLELPEVDYRIGAVNTPVSTDVTAAAGFTNTRFAAQGQIDSRVSGPDAPDLLTGRLQSGIAFVDGTFGVSRDPGRGFYMFRRHETLRDAQIDIRSGSIGRTRARADAFGPGIVPVLQPYREEQLQLSVRNAPAGYNLGEGRYTLVPGARSGASIMIGDDAFRTAVATLIADGEPVPLRYGALTNLDTGEQSVFFTNRVGRAAFNDLAAGRYRAVIGDDGAAFEFTIDASDEAFVDLGTITLEQEQ